MLSRIITLLILMNYGCMYHRDSYSSNSKKTNQYDKNSIDIKEYIQRKFSIIQADIINIHDDPYFKKPMRYLAYPINKIINPLVDSLRIDTVNSSIIFECKDGYKPSVAITDLKKNNNAFLAFRDLSSIKSLFPDTTHSILEPYYLIWRVETDSIGKKMQWPFGITRIKFSSTWTEYNVLNPGNDKATQTGYLLFLQHCIKCHSLNRLGGSVGPDLNYPKNVASYWKKKDIFLFIKNPKSYRYNTKMPEKQDNLSDKDIRSIIRYIVSLKANVKNSNNTNHE